MNQAQSLLEFDQPSVDAVRLGLLRFPESGQQFTDRAGRPCGFVTDARRAGTNLPLRKLITHRLRERLPSLKCFDTFAGLVKAGTMWAAALAWDMDLPVASVLSEPKPHGMGRVIEGD